MMYLNVNGLDGFIFAELLMFMTLETVDCLVLINARVVQERVSFLRREARAHLGPRAECLVSVPKTNPARVSSLTPSRWVVTPSS